MSPLFVDDLRAVEDFAARAVACLEEVADLARRGIVPAKAQVRAEELAGEWEGWCDIQGRTT